MTTNRTIGFGFVFVSCVRACECMGARDVVPPMLWSISGHMLLGPPALPPSPPSSGAPDPQPGTTNRI